MTMQLAKLHATGNDFLVRLALDPRDGDLDARTVVALCDRHRGVGADGVLTIGPPPDRADCTMTLVNADGGRAEMSGNGIRCLAWEAVRVGLARGDALTVATDAGIRTVHVERRDGAVVGAEVDMGPVTFVPDQIPVAVDDPFGMVAMVDGTRYEGDAAGMGNPHFVCFVDDPEQVPVARHGPQLEGDARFPRRTNVEFVAVDGDDTLRMRVWERGAGETQSCGTGACAAAAVAQRRGLVGDAVDVLVPGGALTVRLADHVWLGGPVVHVFDVEVPWAEVVSPA
jgi:diaminopimelate epimerase